MGKGGNNKCERNQVGMDAGSASGVTAVHKRTQQMRGRAYGEGRGLSIRFDAGPEEVLAQRNMLQFRGRQLLVGEGGLTEPLGHVRSSEGPEGMDRDLELRLPLVAETPKRRGLRKPPRTPLERHESYKAQRLDIDTPCFVYFANHDLAKGAPSVRMGPFRSLSMTNGKLYGDSAMIGALALDGSWHPKDGQDRLRYRGAMQTVSLQEARPDRFVDAEGYVGTSEALARAGTDGLGEGYLTGKYDRPVLTDGLRVTGSPAQPDTMRVHLDDMDELVSRIREYEQAHRAGGSGFHGGANALSSETQYFDTYRGPLGIPADRDHDRA